MANAYCVRGRLLQRMPSTCLPLPQARRIPNTCPCSWSHCCGMISVACMLQSAVWLSHPCCIHVACLLLSAACRLRYCCTRGAYLLHVRCMPVRCMCCVSCACLLHVRCTPCRTPHCTPSCMPSCTSRRMPVAWARPLYQFPAKS